MANILERLDAQIAAVLSEWSLLTTIITIILAAVVAYPIIFSEDPDTHPLLLARQASISPVRNKRESALYRSPESPHGYPLKSGLNVRDPNDPKWKGGRDGDLRDVWREVQRGGGKDVDGKDVPAGLFMTVFGKEEVVQHDIQQLSKEIAIIGKQMKDAGVKKIALYMPNSAEYLLAVFACSFYGLTPILLPYNLPHPKFYELLNSTSADALICAAGSVPLDDIASQCTNIRQLTWVVEKTSRHMDWAGVPDSAQNRLSVSVWHDVVQEKESHATGSLPTNQEGDAPAEVITIWQHHTNLDVKPEIVSFTHQNLAAATSALISCIPARQRYSADDLFLLASSFHVPYVLCQTFAALFQHCSIAITSVAEPGVDLALATRSVSPTIIVASAETMANLHRKETAGVTSAAQRVGKYSQSQTMSAGRMPTDGLLFRLLAPSASAAGNKPGKLRLILTSERLGAGTPPLTSTMLSDLRIFTRARICYALTSAKVAGAVAQTHVFDYRREDGLGHAPFGPPLSCVELKLLNQDDAKLGVGNPEGEIEVSGPAVSGGEAKLGVNGQFGEDGALRLR